MTIEATLANPQETERLRTAAYRFAELKRIAPPAVERDGLMRFPTPEQAAEFRAYWRAFRAEPRSWSGFRDV